MSIPETGSPVPDRGRGTPITATSLLRVVLKPVNTSFLAETLNVRPEQIDQQLQYAGITPLSFEEQRQMVRNLQEAEKVDPGASKAELVEIERRQARGDKTKYYGIVRSVDSLRNPTLEDQRAQEYLNEILFKDIFGE